MVSGLRSSGVRRSEAEEGVAATREETIFRAADRTSGASAMSRVSVADGLWTEEQRRPEERSGGGRRCDEGRDHLPGGGPHERSECDGQSGGRRWSLD